jgi:hypothetical protein
VAHLHRLYEQQRGRPSMARELDAYVRRWWQWVVSGLHDWVMILRRPSCDCGAMPDPIDPP